MIVFAAPTFLWGLFAATLPWLLRRRVPREIPRVPFAFLSFLRELEAQEFLSPRVQEWLLLLLRVLIIVGLVLAASDPAWVSSQWAQTRSQARAALDARAGQEAVLLLDRSASMRWITGGVSTWELAVNQARQLLQSGPNRNWALGFWTDGRGISTPLLDRLHRGSVSDLVAVLDETEPLDRPSDFQPLVRAITREGIAGPVVLLTDHQASGWQGLLSALRPGAVPLWVVRLGEPPGSGVWIEIERCSSFPWAVGMEEEVQVTVRQWREPAETDLALQLRLEEPEPIVLAQAPCTLDPSSNADEVVEHPVRLSVRLGARPGERGGLPLALVLVAEDGDQAPLARLSGEIPLLSERPLSLVGEGSFLQAVSDSLRTEGVARPFSTTRRAGFEQVPSEDLAVTALSALSARPGGIGQAAAWVRQGGRCLLLIDREIDAAAMGAELGLLLPWESTAAGALFERVSLEEDHPIAAAFADWPQEAWREWRSYIPGFSPTARRIAHLQGAGPGRVDLIGEVPAGLGRLVFLNVGFGVQTGPERSPLFPVAVIESLKLLARESRSERLLPVGPRLEADVRPLSNRNPEALTRTEPVRFVEIDQITRGGGLLASPVRLRSALLALVILLGLIELWLANRSVSA